MVKKILAFIVFLVIFYPPVASASRAALIIRSANGDEKSFCLDFDEQSIDGIDLLERNRLSPILDNGFLVEIGGERAKSGWGGNAYDDYWSYWQNQNGEWVYSRAGAKYSRIVDGSLWSWQRGDSNLKISDYNFFNICPKKVISNSENQENKIGQNLEDNQISIVDESTVAENQNPINIDDTSADYSANRGTQNIGDNSDDNEGIKLSPPKGNEINFSQGGVAGVTDTSNTENRLYYIISAAGLLIGFSGSIVYLRLKRKHRF
jgi:hypothetical protein